MTDSIYTFKIEVTNPQKIGDIIEAYVSYSVITEADHPSFPEQKYEVKRRFREFHALYETLVDTYRDKGYYIPHPPEKSVKTLATIKTASKDPADLTQIEHRRYSLQSFLNRIAKCSKINNDPIFVDFLTAPVTRVKPRDTLLKLRDSLAFPMSFFSLESSELDKWYQEKIENIFQLDSAMLQLFYTGVDIHANRKDLISKTKSFITALGELRSSEQNDSVVNAYGSLIKLKEKACAIYEREALNDLHSLIGCPRDVLDDLISVKHTMHLYVKKFGEVRSLAEKIDKLKEQKERLQASPQTSASDMTKSQAMIEEIERRHNHAHKDLEQYYDSMKVDIEHFHRLRNGTFCEALLLYVSQLKESQEELLKLWQEALPICQEIQ